jgi:TfoX N-terminal domain
VQAAGSLIVRVGGDDAVGDARTLLAVAYDEELANRIREVLGADPDVTEQRAFGGLAFMVSGNMAIAASGQGGLLVRVDPAESDALVAQGTARPMEMRDRPMKGWLRVATADVRTKGQLASWVTTGVRFARTLPPKVS